MCDRMGGRGKKNGQKKGKKEREKILSYRFRFDILFCRFFSLCLRKSSIKKFCGFSSSSSSSSSDYYFFVFHFPSSSSPSSSSSSSSYPSLLNFPRRKMEDDGFSAPSPLSLFADLLSFIESSKETNTLEEEEKEEPRELKKKLEELEQLIKEKKKKKKEEKDEKEEGEEVKEFHNKALLMLLRRDSIPDPKRLPLLKVSTSFVSFFVFFPFLLLLFLFPFPSTFLLSLASLLLLTVAPHSVYSPSSSLRPFYYYIIPAP